MNVEKLPIVLAILMSSTSGGLLPGKSAHAELQAFECSYNPTMPLRDIYVNRAAGFTHEYVDPGGGWHLVLWAWFCIVKSKA